MTLREFLMREGTQTISRKLNLTDRAVDVWKYEKGLPRPQIMKKLVRMSQGQLSYESIIEGFLRSRKNNH